MDNNCINDILTWLITNWLWDFIKVIFWAMLWWFWHKYYNKIYVEWRKNTIKQKWKWNFAKVKWNENYIDQSN